ncbi:hypothetical protein V6R85_24195 [Agrobacterium sp. CCNWLW32]|uniref:hypothetical protein n=1 Tax=Agrobacterium sp. CCNWLW32 TaxID=3122072 RepID=UPI00300FC695
MNTLIKPLQIIQSYTTDDSAKQTKSFSPPRPSSPAIVHLANALREPYDAVYDDARQESLMTPERLAANAIITTFYGQIDSHHCPFIDKEDGRGELVDGVANIIRHAFDPESRKEAEAIASVHW